MMMADRTYNLFKPGYLDSLSPEELILADYHLLIRLSEEDKAAGEKQKSKPMLDKHPGLVRRVSLEEHMERREKSPL